MTPRTMAAKEAIPRGSALAHLSLISQEKVSPQNAREALTAAFAADDYIDCIKDLRGLNIDPQAYIDGLDQVRSRLSVLVSIQANNRFTSDNKLPLVRVR